MEFDAVRRPSVRARLRTEEDISSWVKANRPNYVPVECVKEEEHHVHFAPPDTHRSKVSLLSTETSSTESSCDQQPVALDGGYAWVIVFISFCIHLICDGLSFSFGIIFPEMQRVFKCSKFSASVVGSFYLALPLLAGPLAGTLTDIYDCRKTTIIGGTMATLGVLLSCICPVNVGLFGATFGVITGIGLCFCYNSGIVVVTYYFERNRALATALAVCGSGAGTFIFPPLIETLLTKYGFWPTILCFAFFFFLLVILGFLMKDVEWPNETVEYKQRKFIKKLDKMRDRDKESLRNDPGGFNALLPTRDSVLTIPRRACSLPVIPSYADDFLRRIEPSASIQSVRKAVSSLQDPVARSRSVAVFGSSRPKNVLPIVPEYSMLVDTKLEHLDLHLSNSPYATVNSKSRVRMYSNCSMSMDALDQIAQRPKFNEDDDESSSDSEVSNDGDSSSSELSDKILTEKNGQLKEVKLIVPNGDQTLKVENGFGAIDKVPIGISQSARGVRSSVISGYTHSRVPASNAVGLRNCRYVALREPLFRGLQSKAPSAPALFVKKKKKKTLRDVLHLRQMKATFVETFREYRRLSKDPRFSCFLFSIFILYMFFDIPYVNFPEYTQEHLGTPINETSWLVSGIGLFNLASMVLCGIVCDKPWARKKLFLLYGVMICMAGFCLLASTMATTYLMMQAISCCYGLFIAANYVLASVLLCELLCVTDFQNGYGFLCLVEGVANLIGPALVGWVRDVTQSYTYMFIVGGIGVIISGLIVVGIHFTIDDEEDSDNESEQSGKTRKQKKSITDSPVRDRLLRKSPTKENGTNGLIPPLDLN